MKAAVFTGVGQPLQIRQLPDPEPGPGEVILKVNRCGICATELHMTSIEDTMFPSGMILGHEVSGEIIAVGPGVREFKPGDAVVPMTSRGCEKCIHCLSGHFFLCTERRFNWGGYAQYMVSSALSCVRVPAGCSLADAALVEPLAVGLLGITSAPVRLGDRVLVIGAGPIALAAVYWAERSGARRVAVVAPSNRRARLAMDMGAAAFITMDEGYEDEVVHALDGHPDVVVECAGVTGAIAQAIDLAKIDGTVVILGFCTCADTFVPINALYKRLKLHFCLGTDKGQFEIAADALSRGFIAPRSMVTSTISLDDVPTEFEALRGRTAQCKVLIAP